MVFTRGSNLVGPENRDERGAYEELEDRVKKYMKMPDDEWKELYDRMYHDRKYPGQNHFKLALVSSIGYVGFAATFSYTLYLRRHAFFKYPMNPVMLIAIPIFGMLSLRNFDVAMDIIKYRKRYPEMYQG
ncbi:unnamed protein product [Blepharisma stoltei]|uniref:Transmembrane protein n=1 Tax=Blepharisma stoltei TaxID=1481888 RepID=A0AAU9J6P0_9CILI|nr:unnamed protein product [Blepharisma stoltei]